MSAACSPAPAPSPPNIVVIVTDDQAFSTLRHMPLVDRHLVQKGLRLDNFILNDPICCPSRVTILLGQYRHNHHQETGWPGCASIFFKNGSAKFEIGRLMRDAGYRTGMIGKYLNSYGRYFIETPRAKGEGLMEGWDDYHTLTGSTKYTEFMMDENGTVNGPATKHQSDVLAELAVRFIEESAMQARPFFLYVTPQAPHAPAKPARRHRGHFPHARAPRPPSFDQADTAGQPSLAKTRPLSAKDIDRIDYTYRRTLQTMQSVDELVRDVVLSLERNGLLETTYIFYTSDNGLHFGEHRIPKGKGTPFEESIRFPLIVRGPGIAEGTVSPQLVSNVDLHPTLLALIGEEPGPKVDGRSLLPLFGAPSTVTPWRTALVIESDHERRNHGVPRFRGVRTLRHKLIEYETGEAELYDLERDPHETRNVLDEVDPNLVRGLRERLDALAHCSGRECQAVENEPTRLAAVP